MGQLAIGVDLGGTAVKVGLVHSEEQLAEHRTLPTEASDGPVHVVDQILNGIESFGADLDSIVGVGIGAPGSINLDRTTVSYPPNFPGWGEVNLSEVIGSKLGLEIPIVVDNDANAAALGSAHFGAGKAFCSFLMVTLGTGVGGAIIYNRRLVRGTTGAAGEIGHISVDYNGPVAAAGIPGVIEAYVGQRFLSAHARLRLELAEAPILRRLVGGDLADLTPRHLAEAARAGDETAIEILAWAGHKLGWGLGSAVNLLDIRKIVVGGGVSGARELILEPARNALEQAVMPGMRDGLELVRETLGNQAGMLGAAQLAFHHEKE